MIPILLAIPGKLQALVTRLTAARAANLDNLDTTVSSRAPAATALSTAVWTPAHAAALLGGGGLNKSLQFTSPGGFTFDVPLGVSLVWVTVQGPGGCGAQSGTGGGGGAGELLRRISYAVIPGGTVSGNIGAGNTTGAKSTTFGTLTAQGGATPSSTSGGNGGGALKGVGGTSGTVGGTGGEQLDVLGGAGGGGMGSNGGPCAQFAGGQGFASSGGGGGSSMFSRGAAGTQLSQQPLKPGFGAGGGGGGNPSRGSGGDGYVLVEWVGS